MRLNSARGRRENYLPLHFALPIAEENEVSEMEEVRSPDSTSPFENQILMS
jgi:hypothetical protein